jgi:hypothetical protein
VHAGEWGFSLGDDSLQLQFGDGGANFVVV